LLRDGEWGHGCENFLPNRAGLGRHYMLEFSLSTSLFSMRNHTTCPSLF
jgi:hypothetical protein